MNQSIFSLEDFWLRSTQGAIVIAQTNQFISFLNEFKVISN